MSLVVAIDDIKPDQVKHRQRGKPGSPGVTTTTFFRGSSDMPDFPAAFQNWYHPGLLNGAHYHATDQFQIAVDGKAKFRRHDASPYCVHFSRAYTPYGPILADKETGWTFLVLRTHHDSGAQRSKEKLKEIPDRRPWQITKKIAFPPPGPGVSVQDIPEIKDDQGLFVQALTMAPHTRTVAPSPHNGDGQFVVVFTGSLVHDNRERKALSVAFVKPDEPAFQIHAGAEGLQGCIFNLPQVKPRTADVKVPSGVAGFKKWQCALCGFAYDEALGMPEDRIPAGTRWQDVPETWSCPDCSAGKSDFQTN